MKYRSTIKRHLVSAAILGLGGTMLGCSAGSFDEEVVSHEEDTLTEANDTNRVRLAADRVLAVKLDARPSAGAVWKIDTIDTNVLQVADKDLEAAPGLGGIDRQIMRFVGVSKGTTVLKLSYGRPWENAPEKTYTVQVEVEGEYNGNFQPAPAAVMAAADEEPPRVGLPQRYNVCDLGGCTPIKNQGSCGSCWAFATAAVVESAIALKDGVKRDVSEQYLISCNEDNMSCAGGHYWAFSYFIDKVPRRQLDAGVVLESDFPYTNSNGSCNASYQHHEKMVSYHGLPNNVNSIKQAIVDHGAVYTHMCADEPVSQYRSGIFRGSHCPGENHGVVLVGWDDNGGDGYWIMRNSWGNHWGEDGYMRIKWGANLIGNAAHYVTYNSSGGGSDDSDNDCPVRLFEHSDYAGKSTCLDVGRWDIGTLRATIGNDTVSSVKVAPGHRATLYAARAFGGSRKVVTGDTTFLRDFNDVTSSVVVERR